MNYYDENAQEFFDGTVNADMIRHHEEFLKLLPKKGHILDAGCGSGRDAKMFISKGFDVTAIDGSQKMCEIASEFIGQDVKHMQFQEIEFENEFDGIWASASLLHVSSDEIEMVLKRLEKSLKANGIFYASFKLGDFEGMRNGRYFTDHSEKSARELFEKSGFEILKTWITFDSRPERKDEKWVNILVKKQ